MKCFRQDRSLSSIPGTMAMYCSITGTVMAKLIFSVSMISHAFTGSKSGMNTMEHPTWILAKIGARPPI